MKKELDPFAYWLLIMQCHKCSEWWLEPVRRREERPVLVSAWCTNCRALCSRYFYDPDGDNKYGEEPMLSLMQEIGRIRRSIARATARRTSRK